MTKFYLRADAWIGLEWNIADAQYQWSDNWPVWYTKWGEGFPDSNNPKRCVAITENKNMQSEWIQSDCNDVKVGSILRYFNFYMGVNLQILGFDLYGSFA